MKEIKKHLTGNITLKLIGLILVGIVFFAIVISLIQSYRAYNKYLYFQKEKIEFIEKTYSQSFLQNAYDINTSKLGIIADGIINSGEISYIKISEYNQSVETLILNEQGFKSAHGDTFRLYYKQIFPEAAENQYLQIILHSKILNYNEFLFQVASHFLISIFLSLLPLAFFIYLLMYKGVIKQLKKAAHYLENFNMANEMDELKFDRPFILNSKYDEIGILEKSINILRTNSINYNN